MTLLWWHWIVFGLSLILAEIASPGGFYIIFFGIAAVLIGALAGVGAAGPVWMQLFLFSVLSIGSLVLFRNRLLTWFQVDPQAPAIDTLVGEVGTVHEDLAPGGIGKVELRGTAWSARNTSSAPLARGARCLVVRVDGLTLDVRPEGVRS
jgi:hypothetical protein